MGRMAVLKIPRQCKWEVKGSNLVDGGIFGNQSTRSSSSREFKEVNETQILFRFRWFQFVHCEENNEAILMGLHQLVGAAPVAKNPVVFTLKRKQIQPTQTT